MEQARGPISPRATGSRLGGRNVGTLVFETGRRRGSTTTATTRVEASVWMAAGLRSAVGVPISVEGRLWGSVVVMSMSEEPLPAGHGGAARRVYRARRHRDRQCRGAR